MRAACVLIALVVVGCNNTTSPEVSGRPHELQMQRAIAAAQSNNSADTSVPPLPPIAESPPASADIRTEGGSQSRPRASDAAHPTGLTAVAGQSKSGDTQSAADAGLPNGAVAAPSADRGERFVPPYPDRRELFVPPDGVHPELARAVRRRAGSIRLKGFVQVDGLRALVEIDDEVAALAVGETHRGVRVLEIRPPEATFQRGSRRWTISLWDGLIDPAGSSSLSNSDGAPGQRGGRGRSASAAADRTRNEDNENADATEPIDDLQQFTPPDALLIEELLGDEAGDLTAPQHDKLNADGGDIGHAPDTASGETAPVLEADD